MAFSTTILLVAACAMVLPLTFVSLRKGRESPCSFIWGCLFLALFIIAPISLHGAERYAKSVRGNYIVDETIYLTYAIAVLVASVAFFGAVMFRASQGDRARHIEAGADVVVRPSARETMLLFGLAICVVAGVLLFIHGTGMSLRQLLVASRFDWYTTGTMNRGVLGLGLYLVAVAAVYSYLDVKFAFPYKWLTMLVLVAIVVNVATAGGRKALLYVGSGLVAGYYDRYGGEWIADRKLILGLALIAGLAFSWQFGRSVDWTNTSDAAEVGAMFIEEAPRVFTEGDATYFYRISLDAIRLNRDHGVSVPLGVFRRIAFLVVPDEWTFGLKPEGLPKTFAAAMGADTSARTGNLPPGLIGLFVLSFGIWFGPVVLAGTVVVGLWGVDRFVTQGRSMLRVPVFATFGAMSILLMRGSTGGLYFMAFNCVVFIGLWSGAALLEFLWRGFRREAMNPGRSDTS